MKRFTRFAGAGPASAFVLQPSRALLAALLAVAVLAIGLPGCGSDKQPAPAGQSLEQVLTELDQMDVPDGVDPAVFEQLRDGLAAELSAGDQSRFVSSLPNPFYNELEIQTLDNGDGTTTLRWSYRNRGDYDLNSEVSVADLTPLGANFLNRDPGGFQVNSYRWNIDGDRNSEINLADLTPIAAGFRNRVDGYNVYVSADVGEECGWNLVEQITWAEREIISGFVPQFSATILSPGGSEVLVLPYNAEQPAEPDDGGGEPVDGGEEPVTVGAVVGIVVDENSAPLANVGVMLGEATQQTDAEGKFLFSDLAPAEAASVCFSLDGYMEGCVPVDIVAGQTSEANLTMRQRSAPAQIDATAGGPLPTASMVGLTLPPNALVGAGGTPLSGPVDISLTYIDPTSDAQLAAAPGNMRAEQLSGDVVRLESFGMAEVFIDDGNGGHANLAPGMTAEMTFAIPQEQQASAPDTIGMYSFDMESGLWIEEGTAVKNQTGTAYIAEVSHFSYWNMDVAPDATCVKVLVTDQNGIPVPNAKVFAEGIDYSGVTDRMTDADGYAIFDVKAGAHERFYADRLGKASDVVEIENPVDVLGCKLHEDPPLVATLVIVDPPIESPVAVITDLGSPILGIPVPFDAVLEADQSTAGSGAIVRYEWDFDGPGPLPFVDFGSQISVNHLFETPGRTAVSLRVTNSYGLQDTDTTQFCLIEE